MDSHKDILDTISCGVLAMDDELRVLAVNSAAQALLELSEARTVGHFASALASSPEEAWLEVLQQVRDSRSPLARRGLTLVLHNGQDIHVDLVVTPVNEGGLVVELQAVDRLLKISREAGLLNAQEYTRSVVRGLAHEIKNPLGGVRGAAQLLSRQLRDEALLEYTQIIISEADRLRDLVDRLQGPNRELQLQSLNVHEVAEHVRNLVEAESGQDVTFRRDYDPSLPLVPGDRTQLTQAMLNIMRNALQAAESASSCEIEIRTRARRQFTIANTRHRLVLQLDIIDNGPGIPEHLQPSIFLPMVTGRADGTGLGLSIAHVIINRHGGLLECDSTPGATRFSIFLPTELSNNA
jgi:two-component system nitrogen regulation sensor histidine kinase GlnL